MSSGRGPRYIYPPEELAFRTFTQPVATIQSLQHPLNRKPECLGNLVPFNIFPKLYDSSGQFNAHGGCVPIPTKEEVAVLREHRLGVVRIPHVKEDVVKVTVLYPLEPLGGSLDFSGELMKRQIDQGYSDAKDLLTPST